MRTVMSVGASDSACVPGAPSLGISNSCRRSADIVRCLLRKSYPLHRHLHAALYPSAHSHSKHHVASSSFQHRFRDAHAPANCRPRRSRGDVWVSSPLQRPASLRPAASGLLLRPKQPLHRPLHPRLVVAVAVAYCSFLAAEPSPAPRHLFPPAARLEFPLRFVLYLRHVQLLRQLSSSFLDQVTPCACTPTPAFRTTTTI